MMKSGSLAEIWAKSWRSISPRQFIFQPRRHLVATVDWIYQACAVVKDGGISKGYDLLRDRWSPSYPETTGYTIPTLLNAAVALDRPELQTLSYTLAEYLLSNATAEGGVAHWQPSSNPQPVVFDTGQVIFGWLAAFESSRDQRFLDAAMQAGDWLTSVQDSSGAWQDYQHQDVVKVIDTRVAWALLSLHQHVNRDAYRQAAMNNLEWALQQQEADGWFRHCAFANGQDPFTHTIAYTAEGLLECGQLLDKPRYVTAARLTADALLARQQRDGSLASTYGTGWSVTSRSSCLTGNCQMASLWLRLYEINGDETYRAAAAKAIKFVAHTQNLSSIDPNIKGAIAGSQPIYGRYERFKYPNWAAKFFIDALLALELTEGTIEDLPYTG